MPSIIVLKSLFLVELPTHLAFVHSQQSFKKRVEKNHMTQDG